MGAVLLALGSWHVACVCLQQGTCVSAEFGTLIVQLLEASSEILDPLIRAVDWLI